jgi:hypothetical protein
MAGTVRIYDVAQRDQREVQAGEFCTYVPIGMDVLEGVAHEIGDPAPEAAVSLEYHELGGTTVRARLQTFRISARPDGEFLFRSGDADRAGHRLWHVARLAPSY